MKDYEAKVKAVTVEQIRSAAQKYLIADTKTVAVLIPVTIDATN